MKGCWRQSCSFSLIFAWLDSKNECLDLYSILLCIPWLSFFYSCSSSHEMTQENPKTRDQASSGKSSASWCTECYVSCPGLFMQSFYCVVFAVVFGKGMRVHSMKLINIFVLFIVLQLTTSDLNNTDQVAFISVGEATSSSPYTSTTMSLRDASTFQPFSSPPPTSKFNGRKSEDRIPFTSFDDSNVDLLT